MKKIIMPALIILIAVLYLTACKKSDKKQTTAEKIQTKWQLVTVVDNDHFSDQDNVSTITGTASDYIDFRTDGKVYTSILDQKDTTAYSVSGDTKIVIDGNLNYDIVTLTSASLILHEKEDGSGTDFYEETITLKK